MSHEPENQDRSSNDNQGKPLQEVAGSSADSAVPRQRQQHQTVTVSAVVAAVTANGDHSSTRTRSLCSPSTIATHTAGKGDESRGSGTLDELAASASTTGESCGDGRAGGSDDVEERSNVQFPWKVNAS